jgi:hypothetical protein
MKYCGKLKNLHPFNLQIDTLVGIFLIFIPHKQCISKRWKSCKQKHNKENTSLRISIYLGRCNGKCIYMHSQAGHHDIQYAML